MTHRIDDDARRELPESEVLMTRLLDGTASEEDRDRFEADAELDPSLWRALALRQQDAVALAAALEPVLEAADRIDLPPARAAGRLLPRRLSWSLAFAGWAAVLVVAATWSIVALTERARHLDGGAEMVEAPIRAFERLSPEDAYHRYLDAPYVLGDMAPVVLETELLSDGRVAIHFIRRIEEIAFLDPLDELPITDDGELTSDPAELRRHEPVVRPLDRMN